MKKDYSQLVAKFQNLGGTMMIPIIVLVICGFCMGFGSPFVNFILTKGTFLHTVALCFMKIGGMIMGYLPVWFTVGIAFGLSKEQKGWAAFASIFLFLSVETVISTLLSVNGINQGSANVEGLVALGYTAEYASVYMRTFKQVCGIFTYDMSIFISLICGGTTALLMNKWGDKKVPTLLSFFAGAKFVMLIIPFFAVAIGGVLFVIWPSINDGIQAVAAFIGQSGLFGTFIHRCMDRALLPFGLHHLINFPLFYSELGGIMEVDGILYAGSTNIKNALIASPTATSYLVRNWGQGKIAINVGAWTGAMLAMYHTSLPSNKQKVMALMIPALFTAAVVGVTEPMEFTVLFANPLLYYLVHVPLAGLAAVLQEATAVSIEGDALIFMISNILQPDKVQAFSLLWIVPLMGILYYVSFRFLIVKFDIKTPGRTEEKVKFKSKKEYQKSVGIIKDGENTEDQLEREIIDAFGGADNIVSVENCISRLRVGVKDEALVQPKEFWVEELEATGVVVNGKNFQIIYGTRVINIAATVKKLLGR
ncbi:MAG: PTS transporter subunit EIIC [Longicatena sp.]